MTEEKVQHIPVLLEETIEALKIRGDGVYADLTLGGGEHFSKIKERITTGLLIGVDRDPASIAAVGRRYEGDDRVRLFNENFSRIAEIWKREELPPADGILMDLGFSSIQIDSGGRGFSFMHDGPLDMKYGKNEPGPNAAEYINTVSEEEMRDLFYRYGEKHARRIARKIAERRAEVPIETTGQLAELVSKAAPHKPGRHPATQVFLALRVEVNREMEAIEAGVPGAMSVLGSGGRLVVITYQSEEDRIVKDLFRRAARGCRCNLPPDECMCNNPPSARLVNKKVITPAPEEIKENARARSAKMRAVEKS